MLDSNCKRHLITIGYIWLPCFLVLGIAYVLLFRPLNKHTSALKLQYESTKVQAEEAELAAGESTASLLDQQIEQLNDRLDDFVFEPADMVNLTFEISRISNQTGLSSFQISPVGNESLVMLDECKYIQGRRVNVSFMASFNEFAEFLNALERHRPVIFIDTFSVVKSRVDDSKHSVEMNLAVLVRQNQNET